MYQGALVLLLLSLPGCYVTVAGPGRRTAGAAVVTGPSVAYAPPPAPGVVYAPGPPPYRSAVWVEGHWEWDGYQYVWSDGYWVDGRDGCDFVQPRWENRGGAYVYVPGGYRDRRSGVIVGAPPPSRGGVGRGVTGREAGTVIVEPARPPGGVVVRPPPDRSGGVVVTPPPDRSGGVVVTPPPSGGSGRGGRGSGGVVVTPPPSGGSGGVVVTPPPSGGSSGRSGGSVIVTPR